jgi:hypothetical protein
MTTRRTFLRQGGAAAGALAIGCNPQETRPDAAKEAAGGAPPTNTLELVIGGLFLFVEDQRENLIHIVAPTTSDHQTPHDTYLLFSRSSARPPMRLDRAAIDLSSLAQGTLVLPSDMLDLNDVVHGRRLRLDREHIRPDRMPASADMANQVILRGGELRELPGVERECCMIGNREFKVTGRLQWSCPVNAATLVLKRTSLVDGSTMPTEDVVAESGTISLGLVNDYGDVLPHVEALKELQGESDWNHFKAFYRFWQGVGQSAPRNCMRKPSQCGPSRVAVQTDP